MAEAEEVKTETVTVTLTEDTLAGLRLIAEHKGITVEEVIGRLASAAAKTAHTAIAQLISEDLTDLNAKKDEFLKQMRERREQNKRNPPNP